MPLDAASYYLIRSSIGTSVLARRGDGAPTIVSGGARYNVTNRPRRTSIVTWDGDDPYRMDVPIMLDGWANETSVESDVAKIEQMRHSQGDLVPPVLVYIDGAVPVKGARWVVESIDWGAAVIWQAKGEAGYRLRQDGIIHLLQAIPQTVLAVSNASTGVKQHRVAATETVASIAVKHKTTVAAIKKLNTIRDPKTVSIGDIIKIPPITELGQG